MASEAPPLFSIGTVVGGISADNQAARDSIQALQKLVIREREQFLNDGLRLNVVFHIPGPISQPDYEGTHANRLDRKANLLLVVSAVPAGMTTAEVPAYLAEVLEVASVEAREYLERRRVNYDLRNIEALIDYLVSTLTVKGLPDIV